MSVDSSSTSDRRSSSGSVSDSEVFLIKPIGFEDELQLRMRHVASLCRAWKKRYVTLKAQHDSVANALYFNRVEFKKNFTAQKMAYSSKMGELESQLKQLSSRSDEIFREKTSLETAFKKTLEKNRTAYTKWQDSLDEKDVRIHELEEKLQEQTKELDSARQKLGEAEQQVAQLTERNKDMEKTLEQAASQDVVREESTTAESESDTTWDQPRGQSLEHVEYKLLYELALCKLQMYEKKYGKHIPSQPPTLTGTSKYSTQVSRAESTLSNCDAPSHRLERTSFLSSSSDMNSPTCASILSADFTMSRMESYDMSGFSSSSSPNDSPRVRMSQSNNEKGLRLFGTRHSVTRSRTLTAADQAEKQATWPMMRRSSLSQPDLTDLDDLRQSQELDQLAKKLNQNSLPSTPVFGRSPSPEFARHGDATMTTSTTSPESLSAFDSLRCRRNGLVDTRLPTDLIGPKLKLQKSRSKDFMDIFKRFHFAHEKKTVVESNKFSWHSDRPESKTDSPPKQSGLRRFSRKKANSTKS